MDLLLTRIAFDPNVREGQVVIRGAGIPVSLILDRLAAGKSYADILTEYPVLEEQDVRAALAYAAALIRGSWFDVMDYVRSAG